MCVLVLVFEQHIFDIVIQLLENEILFFFLSNSIGQMSRITFFPTRCENCFKFVCALAYETAEVFFLASYANRT